MKRLAFPLTLVIILSLLLGTAGCAKPQSDATLPGIVESISPANRASGVEPDATITINFKSPIWTSQLPAPADGEPLSLDSTELADRFRITDATTGEMVEGTVTLEDGVKLTFELATGESWKPHTAYWIEGTAGTSLDEAWSEEESGNLFFSEFTTEDLDEDEFPVNHPFPGGWPDLLTDVAYDVDTSQSLSFEELEAKINSAPTMAEEANSQNQLEDSGIIYFPNEDETVEVSQYPSDFVIKFHFWPNIINLTEVYYNEDDHALFNDILDQLLENEPDQAQLKSALTTQIARGDRVFSACDFITSLWYGFNRFTEVYYGMLINLDNPDGTGVRQPYVQEILVHDYADYGLPCLHDPHTEELANMFNNSAAFAIGDSWDLCLRGNLKKSKYHAIIVDKLAEAPEAEFYIVRVNLNCFCSPFYDGPDSSVPDAPFNPRKDGEPIPGPVWEPQLLPNPNPPKNPQAPPNPQPDPDPANRPVPWPFPPDAIPLPPEAPDEPPTEKLEPPDEEDAPQGCEQPSIDCSDSEAVGDKLTDTKAKIKDAKTKMDADEEKFEDLFDDYDLKLAWLESVEGVTFNDPCLNELLQKLLEDIQPFLEQMKALGEQMNDLTQQIRAIKESDPVIETLLLRSSNWDNMLHVGGSWSQIKTQCLPPAVIIPGGAMEEAVIKIDGEKQETFQRIVGIALMQGKNLEAALQEAQRFVVSAHNVMNRTGKTWNQAVDEVYKNGIVESTGIEGVWDSIWQKYGQCLKDLFTKQLTDYLKQLYGDSITDAQLAQMINVMFNGAAALDDTQKENYQKMLEEVQALQAQQANLAYEMGRLANQIDEKRQEFKSKADKCCFAKTYQDYYRMQQLETILESYSQWCDNRTPKFEVSLIPDSAAGRYAEYIEGSVSRLCAVLCQIKDNDNEKFNGLGGLRSYATWVYNCLCGQHKCEDVVDPCDPECEDCGGEAQPPTPSPEIENCAETLGYDTGLEDCQDGIFPDIATTDYVEFTEYRLNTFLLSPDSYLNEAKRECAQDLTEFLDEAVESDQEWAANIFVDSYLEAQETCQAEIIETEVLGVGLEASAQSVRDASGCRSTLTISFTGQDLTGGSYLVTNVVLKVNGVVWRDSGTISTTYYQNAVSQQVGCGETFNIEVIATNQYGLTATASKSITTPIP
jgi:hypothetical protein